MEDAESNHKSSETTSKKEHDSSRVKNGREVADPVTEYKFDVTSTDTKTFATDGTEVSKETCCYMVESFATT